VPAIDIASDEEQEVTRPNFLIIGAMRAGTTALYEYLNGHPQIFMAAQKELRFFWEQWDLGVGWYESHFEAAGDAIAVGEASPEYTMYPGRRGVAERIAKTLPDVRLIYLMRDPIERMRSDYVWRLAEGMEHRPIADALLADPSYTWTSSYALQIDEYLRYHDRSRILLVLSEDLRARRAESLRTIFEFLGVDPEWIPPNLENDYNEPRPNKPRRSFRVAGGLLIRAAVAAGWRYRPRVLSPRVRALMTEPILPSESVLPDDLRAALGDVLRSDLIRLRELMPAGFDAWGIV
jgi:sulfotransferase family protein